MRHARTGTVALAAAAALAVGASPASATTLQREVDQVLRHSEPGGRQVGPNQVVWARDGVRLTLFGRTRAASSHDCRRGYACLWQDTNFRSRRVEFFRYRTYRLADWGMPPGKRRGASSWANHQTGRARAILSFDFGWFTMPPGGSGNLPPRRNDAAEFITLMKR
jgi:hypothetical protein